MLSHEVFPVNRINRISKMEENMQNEIGYQIDTKLFYIGESIVFMGMAYSFFKKPELMMRKIFKKYSQKLKILSYILSLGFSVIAMESILNLVGVL